MGLPRRDPRARQSDDRQHPGVDQRRRPDRREGSAGRQEALQLALTALLVEAAYSDDHLTRRSARSSRDCSNAASACRGPMRMRCSPPGERAASESAELFHFTRIVNERLSLEERVELIEMLWEVAYADRVLDEYEDSLLRRVGGLIYVPDRERGMARQRVLKRLGLDQAV